MAFGTPDSLLLLHRAVQVSILVFLEWPLGRERLLRQRNRFFRFQSLFFWNGLWDTDRSDPTDRRTFVSILVFLEWPLGQEMPPGSWSNLFGVSILVFLEWPLGHLPGVAQTVRIDVSILVFLEWPLGRRPGSARRRRIGVSILVFLEWPLGLSAAARLTISIAGFNPCFSGMAFGTGVDLLADAILR